MRKVFYLLLFASVLGCSGNLLDNETEKANEVENGEQYLSTEATDYYCDERYRNVGTNDPNIKLKKRLFPDAYEIPYAIAEIKRNFDFFYFGNKRVSEIGVLYRKAITARVMLGIFKREKGFVMV